MTPFRRLIKNLLANLVVFIAMYCVFVTVLHGAFGNFRYTYPSLGLMLVFFLLYLSRAKVKNIVLFVAIHVLFVAAPIILVGQLVLQVLLTAMLIVFVLYSTHAKLHGEPIINFSVIITTTVLLGILFLVSEYFRFYPLTTLHIVCATIILLSCILAMQIENVDNSLDTVITTRIQPIASILRFNNTVILIFLTIGAVIAFTSTFFPSTDVIAGIGSGLLWLIRALLGRRSPSSEALPPIEPELNNQSEFNLEEMLGEGKTSIIWKILETIIIYTAQILLVVAVLTGLIYASYSFYKKFYNRPEKNGDVREFLTPNITKTSIKDILGGFKNLFPVFGNTPSQKLRRAYYKKVNEHIKKGVMIQSSHTADEIAQTIKENEDISNLTQQYQKARYGQEV